MDRASTSALDKFKRRLVRDIARRLHQEKQEQNEIWPVLKTEYGCDCCLLWEHMKSLTLKKLRRLLAAEDRVDYITKRARMTSTDWLTFDLLLVHEKVDVIGEDLILSGKREPAVLTLLFDLVGKYEIDSAPQDSLGERWQSLTDEYNIDGRKCSPMLLQRRWYQLKKLTRSKIYDFWQSYHGNRKFYERAVERKPTELQMKIVEKYGNLITQHFQEWDDLIQNKVVILAEAFESNCFSESTVDKDNDTDIIIIEPSIEIIELAADSDSDEAIQHTEKLDRCTTYQHEDGVTVHNEIEQIIEDVYHIGDVKTNRSDNKQSCEEIDFKTNNIFQMNNVTGNVGSPESNTGVNEITSDNIKVITALENSDIRCNDTDELSLVQHKGIPIFANDNTNDREDPDVVIVDVETKNVESTNGEENLNGLSAHLEFIDDGIEFVDEIEYQESINNSEKDENSTGECAQLLDTDATCTIDRKLIMFPITYTTKIDDMKIFHNKNFLSVKGSDILDHAIAESKPIYKIQKKNEETSEEISTGDPGIIPRVKMTSWRLQKPRRRSYHPIQLCKNPDFNTRLKRLTVGFFSSERNRLLFSACKPITIDLHKGFETKLVNNTIYLESNDNSEEKEVIVVKECSKKVSVVPSVIPIQSLLDNAKEKVQELLQVKTDIPKIPLLLNTSVIERSKVIKLPDKEQMRLNNQNLLVAEVSPISVQDEFNKNNQPMQIIDISNVAPTDPDPSQNTVETDCNVAQVTKVKRIITKKKFILPKVRTPATLPPWSYSTINDSINDYLITQDTLNKMVCLFKGINYDETKTKREYYQKKKVEKGVQLKSVVKNGMKSATTKRNVPNEVKPLKRQIVKRKSRRTHNMLFKTMRSIAWCSGYCCWAQHRLLRTPRDRKFKHLCSPPVCKCCCRDLLMEEYLYGPYCMDQMTYFKKFVVNGRLRSSESISGVAVTAPAEIHEDDEDSEYTDVHDRKAVNKILEQAIAGLPPLDKVNGSNDTLKEDEWINESLEKINVMSDIPIQTETKTIDGPSDILPLQKLSENTITTHLLTTHDDNYISQKPSNFAEPSPKPPPNAVVYSALNIESITTLDASLRPAATEHCINNQILPNGVKFTLLPDNTLTMSIDPNAEIDKETLSKLPEILLAAQQEFTHKRDTVPTNDISEWCNVDLGQNITTAEEKSELAPGFITAHNIPPMVLESNDQPVENTHSYSVVNLIELDNKNNTELIQENKNSKNDIPTLRNDKRKTILSDLMTLSGISQEDFNLTTEESSPVITTSSIPIQSISNNNMESIRNPVQYSLVEQNAPVAKPIKKVVVHVQKNRSLLIDSNCVIDLTEDDPETKYENSSGEQEAAVSDKCVQITDIIETAKSPVEFYSAYSPVKINKVLNTVGVFRMKITDSDTNDNVKHKFDKDFNKSNEKTLYHEDKQETRCVESESDCSDDEPLAKKMRRIRKSSLESINSVNTNIDTIVPVEE